MLDSIYNILSFLPIVLAFIYLIPCTIVLIQKNYNNVKNIKTRIILSSLICILYILRIILSIALHKSSFKFGSNIFCAIIWGLNIVLGYYTLKSARRTSNFEFHIYVDPYWDNSKIIDADGYEIISTDEDSKEITSMEINT